MARHCGGIVALSPIVRLWNSANPEQAGLLFSERYRPRTLLVVVSNVVDPATHGIATHLSTVAGRQQITDLICVLHPRIKPEVIAIGIEDHGHSVVDGGGDLVGGGRQNGTGREPGAAWVFPLVPNSREGE